MTLTNNFNGTAMRHMAFRNIEQYRVGDILTNMVHWSNGGDFTDIGDTPTDYCYEFECENLEGHEVDYIALDEDDENGEERYDAEYAEAVNKYGVTYECSEEREIIVDENAKFEIIGISKVTDEEEITEEDFPHDDVPVVQIKVRMI